jgi:hypothetical protein
MKNPAVIESRNSNDDLDTNTGLPRKLGWTIAIWALGLLQVMIIALLGALISASIQQGKDIAVIKGHLGIAQIPIEQKHYIDWNNASIFGANQFGPIYKEIP